LYGVFSSKRETISDAASTRLPGDRMGLRSELWARREIPSGVFFFAVCAGIVSSGCEDDGKPHDEMLQRPDGGQDALVDGSDPTRLGDAATSGKDDSGLADLTVTIGPSGGTIAAAGLTLTFPAGAISSATAIRIRQTADAMPGYTRLSNGWRVEPANLALAQPVIATMSFAGDLYSAAAFWSDGRGAYENLGGVVDGDTLHAKVTRLGDGFVANGVTYEPPSRHAEAGCGARVRAVAGSATTIVNGVFTVEDCYGTPVRGLSAKDFIPLEDGSSLSVEASGFTVLDSRPSTRGFVTLALDFSSSTNSFREQVIEGARAFVDQVEATGVPVYVGLAPFAGDQSIFASYLAPTLDYERVRSAIDAFHEFAPLDRAATNLRGAVGDAYALTLREAAFFERRNQGGANGLPFVVVFTDGRDTAGFTAMKMPPAGGLFAVGLKSADYRRDELLTLVGGASYAHNLKELSSATELRRDFSQLAGSLATRINAATYRLGYCSAARSGSHTFGVKVSDATTTASDTYGFEAKTTFAQCNPVAIAAVCADKQCGGVACGACDDRSSICDGSQCMSWCKAVGVCEGPTFQNPMGYQLTCNASSCEAPTPRMPAFGSPTFPVLAIPGYDGTQAQSPLAHGTIFPARNHEYYFVTSVKEGSEVRDAFDRYSMAGYPISRVLVPAGWASLAAKPDAVWNDDLTKVFYRGSSVDLLSGVSTGPVSEYFTTRTGRVIDRFYFAIAWPDGRFAVAVSGGFDLYGATGVFERFIALPPPPAATSTLRGCGRSDGGYWIAWYKDVSTRIAVSYDRNDSPLLSFELPSAGHDAVKCIRSELLYSSQDKSIVLVGSSGVRTIAPGGVSADYDPDTHTLTYLTATTPQFLNIVRVDGKTGARMGGTMFSAHNWQRPALLSPRVVAAVTGPTSVNVGAPDAYNFNNGVVIMHDGTLP
jgi:hypothetical protein